MDLRPCGPSARRYYVSSVDNEGGARKRRAPATTKMAGERDGTSIVPASALPPVVHSGHSGRAHYAVLGWRERHERTVTLSSQGVGASTLASGLHAEPPASLDHRSGSHLNAQVSSGLRTMYRHSYLHNGFSTCARPQAQLLRALYADFESAANAFNFDLPWSAANLAILDQNTGGIRVDIERNLLTTVRTANEGGVLHEHELSALSPRCTPSSRAILRLAIKTRVPTGFLP